MKHISVVVTICSLSFYHVSSSNVVVNFVFFFNDTATTEIYTLSLHDALPIWSFLYLILSFTVLCSCFISAQVVTIVIQNIHSQ